MRPIGLVCGGINLEYYFSRVDNIKMGAGTKLPHNVMGLFGVANSSDGDLRPGLPWQMIEVHDPVRLLVIVEHNPDIVLKAIQSSPEVFEWYANEWVHIVSLHPEEKQFTIWRSLLKVPGKWKQIILFTLRRKSARCICWIEKNRKKLNESATYFIYCNSAAVFFASLLWQNKREKAIGKIVRVAKVSNILIAVSIFAWWVSNGLEPISYKMAPLYETNHFVFAIQLYGMK